MNGFIITRYLKKNIANPEVEQGQYHSLGQYSYHIQAENCQLIKKDNAILLLDGYLIPDDIEPLFQALSSNDIGRLNHFDGHFSGVYIHGDEVLAFNDRFGGKTLYWQYYQQQLILCSRSINMPLYDDKKSCEGGWELLKYRWLTGENTLLANVKKLPPHHSLIFKENKNNSPLSYWQLPQPHYDNQALETKVNQTKAILVKNLAKNAKKYKKVAIFLSGGVDSSILAALAKDVFEHCYLITPVFKGAANPELDTAIAFAKSLGLPHQLVEVELDNLSADLTTLTALKCAPLRHYSSLAMMAMMKAIPDDYEAVLYGEAADTLFGSNAIKRVLTHYRWKRQTQFIPSTLLRLFASVVPGRGKILLNLKKQTLRSLILSVTAIKYTPEEMRIITKLLPSHETDIESWGWQKTVNEISPAILRKVTQERILNSDAATHFYEAELIAQHYQKHIISPFFDPKVVQLSATLNDAQYFGEDYVKPVLRELACQFFPRALIYQKKHGFPVPFIDWLAGPLASLVNEVKQEGYLFNGSELEHLNVKDHFELFWLLINWLLVHKHIGERKKKEVK